MLEHIILYKINYETKYIHRLWTGPGLVRIKLVHEVDGVRNLQLISDKPNP